MNRINLQRPILWWKDTARWCMLLIWMAMALGDLMFLENKRYKWLAGLRGIVKRDVRNGELYVYIYIPYTSKDPVFWGRGLKTL